MVGHLTLGDNRRNMGFLSGLSDLLKGESRVENRDYDDKNIKTSEQLKEKDLAAKAEAMGFRDLAERIRTNLKEIDERCSRGDLILADTDKEYIQGVIQKLLSELSVSDPDKRIIPEELERINQDYELLFEKISVPPVLERSKNINPDSSDEELEKIFKSSTELYIYVLKILGLDKKNIDKFIAKQREQVENQLNM